MGRTTPDPWPTLAEERQRITISHERHRIAIHLRLKGRRLMDEGRYLAGHVLIEEADRIEAGGKLLE